VATYRKNLPDTAGHPQMPDSHPAAKYDAVHSKERYGGQENGDTIIDRRDAPLAKVAEKISSTVEQETNGIMQLRQKLKWAHRKPLTEIRRGRDAIVVQ
jgi:hypothetical protein